MDSAPEARVPVECVALTAVGRGVMVVMLCQLIVG